MCYIINNSIYIFSPLIYFPPSFPPSFPSFSSPFISLSFPISLSPSLPPLTDVGWRDGAGCSLRVPRSSHYSLFRRERLSEGERVQPDQGIGWKICKSTLYCDIKYNTHTHIILLLFVFNYSHLHVHVQMYQRTQVHVEMFFRTIIGWIIFFFKKLMFNACGLFLGFPFFLWAPHAGM